MKSTWPISLSGTKSLDRANGIQVLPILWRNSIVFGVDEEEESRRESDLGLYSDDVDDGCPTMDEITLDGAPNIRALVSDVFLDIPMYLTNRYHDQMIQAVTKEVNRVYKSFIERNPEFLKNNGQVSILGHSLGSLLAFDILSVQPFESDAKPNPETLAILTEKKLSIALDFPVKNFFAIGSPLGMIMLLRSHKIVSRKTLDAHNTKNNSNMPAANKSSSLVSFVYPATENVYNIFHKSDPVAYRLEPLVVRHYGAKLKPMPIPYIKGGLKSVVDAGFIVGNDIASKAGAMFESFKLNITGNMLMRGLGLASQVPMKLRSQSDPEIMASRVDSRSAAKLELLNPTGRVDFCLQEGLLENAYISALSVHMSYWQDVDVAGFLIREIYKKEEISDNLTKNKATSF
ncbi:DDHD domain-containing protein [Sporodiniella umbellata]|nr:DDHD domain-containing protein [Sporodiniella umbellata]